MGVHTDCGREIRWAKRSDFRDDEGRERWNPPLEFAGHGFIITEDGYAVYSTIYKHHECDPDEMKLWYDLKRRQAEARGIAVADIDEKEERAIARERDRNEVVGFAMSVSCKVCKAERGEMCMHLNSLKHGEKRYNKNPHPIRIEDAARAS